MKNEHLSARILEDKNIMEMINPEKLPKGLPGSNREEIKINGKIDNKKCLNGIWRSNKILPEKEEKRINFEVGIEIQRKVDKFFSLLPAWNPFY